VYDLQEPFRWIADVAVMDAFESGVLDLPDFYFTGDDYRYRFEPSAKQQFLDLLRKQFNSGVKYKERTSKWDTVIEQKTVELGRYLIGRTAELDFSEPSPKLARDDDREIRKRILSISESEARQLGIARSTYYDLRRNVRRKLSFKVCAKALENLDSHLGSI
jgi:CRISPR-associated protein Cas1